MTIESDFPRGARVGAGDDLTIAERHLPTFGRWCFSLRARGAKRLVIELNDPVVSRISERARSLFATDRFQVVVDDLVSGRKLLRERGLSKQYEQQTQPQI